MELKAESSFWGKNWKGIVNLITICAFAILVWAIRSDLADTFQNLFKIKTWALLLMIPIQFLNYDAQARVYKGIFKIEGSKIGYWKLMRTTLELNFVNHVFPSGGITGISYFSLRLKKEGVSIAKATAAHMLKIILVFLSFELMIVLAVIALAIGGHINNLILLLAGALVTSLVILTLGIGFIIGSQQRISGVFEYFSKLLNKFIHVFRRKNPETINISKVRTLFEDMHGYYRAFSKDWRRLKRPLFWAFMANFWEIMTIYVVYFAFGDLVNIGAVILAYGVANSAGFISVLPGGIGVYEILMTLTLGATGVSSKLSLPVTIMYRVINSLIQVPLGYFAYHYHINSLNPVEQKQYEQKSLDKNEQ